jgi:ribonuclease T1
LPPEARTTLQLIESGGPFPYSKDGTVFHNYEGVLPEKPDGYYREYTVVTPGASDRGARRVVAGSNGERYYTDDHYNTFQLIVE